MIANQNIYDGAVDTRAVAADTIIPADVDETQPYAFSSTSGTWSGVINSTNKTSTIGNLRASLEVQGLNLNVTSTSGFNFNWGSSFSGVPIVSYAKIGASTVAMPVMIIADLAGGTITTSLTGTVNVIGIYGY